MSPSGAEPEEFDPYSFDDDEPTRQPLGVTATTGSPWPTSPRDAPRSPPGRPGEPIRLDVRDLAELHEHPPDRKPFIIDRLLRAGDRMVVVAPRNLGKSWLMLQLAHAVASGEGPFLGPGGFEVNQAARVLALLGETDDSALYDRIITQGYGPPPPGSSLYDAHGQVHLSAESESESFTDERGRTIRRTRAVADLPHGLEQCIVERGVGLLMLDPWAAIYRGDENSNEEVQRALSELDGLIDRTGIAVVITHHPGKGTGSRTTSPEDTWRGASRLADWATTRVTLGEYYTPSQAKKLGLSRLDARRRVGVSVLTRGAPIEDFSMEADPVNRRWSIIAAETHDSRTKISPREAAAACWEAGGFPSTQAAAIKLGVAHATALAGLEAAAREGLVEGQAAPRNATKWTATGPPTSHLPEREVGSRDVP